MTDQRSVFDIRPMRRDEWEDVAELIHESTNAWYVANGKKPIFNGPPSDAMLFCEVYEALDPGLCLVAESSSDHRIAASCFYHPRPTHLSLGIMNVHPDFFGQGLAGALLSRIIEFAKVRELPVRLVSSAQNLDSFSLYTRKGFVPFLSFQDLYIEIPENGPDFAPSDQPFIEEASMKDLAEMVELERELSGIERSKDYAYFIANELGIWRTLTYRDEDSRLLGFLSSVNHPGSRMIGPGVARTEEIAVALLAKQLDGFRGLCPVFLLPVTASHAVRTAYSWGAKNCEIHFAQCLGRYQPPKGVVFPTFMPETG
ncbi:MAG TPA: N-acetyltransferase [Opitutae bacterium]|nr:N-acetyltransferase [Opitutae bacterium]